MARDVSTIFVGGDPDLGASCRPIFDAITPRTVHVGPVGSASVAKLAANLLGGIKLMLEEGERVGGEDLAAVITTLERLAGLRA